MISGREQRVKVSIQCKKCGERFVLKGKHEQGRYQTGFIQCICDNADDFEFVVLQHA